MLQKCPTVYTVAILTGYSAQKAMLERMVSAEKSLLQRLGLEVNTVDAFQGREADIAIYSVTRSNPRGEIGFLSQMERLNVALSRGKVGLVVVGNDEFCRVNQAGNPLYMVLNYIDTHPKDCALELI